MSTRHCFAVCWPWKNWSCRHVVSQSSTKRDYEIKPREYLAFGVDEYWIVDAFKRQLTVHSRWRGQWSVQHLKPTQKFSPLCLPGFTLELKKVFAAGK
jgi:Uma2 family endonuclease